MKIKTVTLFLVLCIVSNAFSQKKINNYKYIIVPKIFDFQKEKDEYQLNSLMAFLFNKYGFQTVMEGDGYPEDINKNRCLALSSDVVKGSGLFKTKLNILLKNCNGQVVFTSKIGESREKDFKKAYTEALRNAFNDIKTLNYKYEPAIQEEIIPSVVAKPIPPKVVTPNDESINIEKTLSSVLYAQEIENGFQLVDSSPKVVYRLKNTGLNNVFLVEGKSAIVYKKGEHWFIDYYSGTTLKQDKLNIKF